MPSHDTQHSPSNTRKLSSQTTPITTRQCIHTKSIQVTPIEKSDNQIEGKDWEMAPTPPLTLDQEHIPKSPPRIPSPGLTLLLNDNMLRNLSSPLMPRYRHVIPDKVSTGHLFSSPSKSPKLNQSPKSQIIFRDSINLMEETEPYDPLSKIEKLRRRLSLLKSQIKQSTRLLSDGNNTFPSPNKNKSTPRQLTPSKSLTSTVQPIFQKNQDDDISDFLLGRNSFSTPSKSKIVLPYDSVRDNTISSTPSRKMSALTLTIKKSPCSRLSTPTNINKFKSPSSSTRKRKSEYTTDTKPIQISTPKTPKQSNMTLQNMVTTPKSLEKKVSTPHSSKRKSGFNIDDIFTPTSKKLKKSTDIDESFNLDLFKTPTPVKPKNPTSIKINGIIRKSLSLDEETVSRNIFEEEEEDFVFRERKKIHKR